MYAVILKDTTTFDGCLGRVQSFHRSFRAAETAMERRLRQIRRDGPGQNNYLPLTVVAIKPGVTGYRIGEWLRTADVDRSCVMGG